eukprot:evm.model.scf_314EXC.8 EVM.evm.TU.scf_314EXC.8   scf_314EXC:36925-39577(+)
MGTQLRRLEGAQVQHQWNSQRANFASTRAPPPSRCALRVEANKKVKKKEQVVLLEPIPNLGQKGEVVTVAAGYWRNYLGPMGKAKPATAALLNSIQAKEAAEIAKQEEIKQKAKAMATALKTIKKFVIKKKAGDQDQIFGSVSAQEVADAIYQQTSRKLDKSLFVIPEIKALGPYEAQVKLHPEVTGSFTIMVQREKIQPQKSK